jgi:hypothetical protein
MSNAYHQCARMVRIPNVNVETQFHAYDVTSTGHEGACEQQVWNRNTTKTWKCPLIQAFCGDLDPEGTTVIRDTACVHLCKMSLIVGITATNRISCVKSKRECAGMS